MMSHVCNSYCKDLRLKPLSGQCMVSRSTSCATVPLHVNVAGEELNAQHTNMRQVCTQRDAEEKDPHHFNDSAYNSPEM